MRKRDIVGPVLASAWLFFPHLAGADELKQTLSNFGLLGKWAVRCGQPPNFQANGNVHATYSMVATNQAELRYDYGRNSSHRVYTITGARPQADGVLLDVYDTSDRIPAKMVMRRVQGRIQIISNQEVNGKVWVRDGIGNDGKPVPSLERCR